MHGDTMHRGHLGHDPVQRQITLGRKPLPQPTTEGGKFALGVVALGFRRKTAGLAFEDHHVVHKARRHPKVPRRLTMPMPLLNKGKHPAAKFHRM